MLQCTLKTSLLCNGHLQTVGSDTSFTWVCTRTGAKGRHVCFSDRKVGVRLRAVIAQNTKVSDNSITQAIRSSTSLKEKVTLRTSKAETTPVPKLSPMENGDHSIKVAVGEERGQGLAVSHRSVPALGASNGNLDRAVEPCLTKEDACDGLQIGVVGEAAQGILMDTCVRSQVGVMLRVPKSL